jgi:hypothetical protein
MLRWRAVGFGVAVAGLLAFFTVLLPLSGHAAVGVAAGFVAGLLGGGRLEGGLHNGTGTALTGGVLLAGFCAAVGWAFGLGNGFLPAVRVWGVPLAGVRFTGADALLVAAAGALAFGALAVAGGILGALARGDHRLPATD